MDRHPSEDRRSDAERMAEAASRPLDFEPKARAQFVRDCIDLIEKYQKEGLTTDEIKDKVPTFVRDYKNLFEMVTQPGGYNKQSLKTMLAMLDRMGTGELTQHQASVIVGQRLADTYIKPNLQQ
ncbi:MAG: hypothetical protein EBU82_00420 [Flavobacteriia bacterium]|jgi:hypothetical protein|nr:hypothetical protein [Flavobacteriia bacterium]